MKTKSITNNVNADITRLLDSEMTSVRRMISATAHDTPEAFMMRDSVARPFSYARDCFIAK